MNDVLKLLVTGTDERLGRFDCGAEAWVNFVERRKKTLVYHAFEGHLPQIIEAATACAVTLQRVHDAGRDEWYETLWQGPMEGWSSRTTPPTKGGK